MTPKQRLLARLADRSPVIGICSLGDIGLPLALLCAEAGAKLLNASRRLVLGIAHKKNIYAMRKLPAANIVKN